MKKVELAKRICSMVRVDRKNSEHPDLSFEEMVFILSWLLLLSDLSECVAKKIPKEKIQNALDVIENASR